MIPETVQSVAGWRTLHARDRYDTRRMPRFVLRTDLDRVILNGFALPLGIVPDDPTPPTAGYTLAYNLGEDDEPDTYTFSVVCSHEKVATIASWAFSLLPEEVSPIIEIDSADAYRATDVYLAAEETPIPRKDFFETWREFLPLLLEDGSIGIGANADDPFVEVFVDQWKTINIHVPIVMRDIVEEGLEKFDLQEVPETWAQPDDPQEETATIRPVLDTTQPDYGTLDDLLLELKRRWTLELNVDPDRNLDQAGRDLGMTLWNAIVIAEDASGDDKRGAFISVWLSARSLTEAEELVLRAVEQSSEWSYSETYHLNRVAFDERPDELASIPPRQEESGVHLVKIEPWEAASDERA